VAVIRIIDPGDFAGRDGDQASMPGATEGSRFHAVDTGRKYVFHDGGWTEDLRDIYVAMAVVS